MQDGKLNTVDIKSNSIISASSSSVPLDSRIGYSELDKNSSAYKDILKKLKLLLV